MKILQLIICIAFFSVPAFATSRYMALTGTDTGDCSGESNPCRTLQYSMSVMESRDTLYIEDGNYTSPENTIDQFHVPPSGTPEAFTVIRAKNIPCQDGIPCNQPLRVRFSGNARFVCNNDNNVAEYVKFWGIRWEGIETYTGWNHIYFKQVASQGILDGNTAAISITGQYNLLEDCIAFGKGRYKIIFYDHSRDAQLNGDGNNLARRCVVRQDWANKDVANTMPIAGIVSYFNRGTACLNCIVIDSDTPSEWNDSTIELAGAFYQPVDNGPHGFILKGCIVINTAMSVLNNRGASSGHVVSDLAAVKVAGGLVIRGSTDVDRVTLVDVGKDNFPYRSAKQDNQVLAPNNGVYFFYDTCTLYDAIICDVLENGVRGGDETCFTSDYINMYQITEEEYLHATQPAHFDSLDPLSNGLSYPMRIESNSTLSSMGNGSGQVGAKILNKFGADGTFKGDPNWDTEQGCLWPWPLEGWIQAEMRTSQYTTDAYRGFCANDTGLYGGPITLTSYIWEYLGNPCPSEFIDTSYIIYYDNPVSFDIKIGSNPFMEITSIKFTLTERTNTSLDIFNILGAKINTTINNVTLDKGIHSYKLDMSNYPQGIYFLRLKTNTEQQILKFDVLR